MDTSLEIPLSPEFHDIGWPGSDLLLTLDVQRPNYSGST